MSAWLIDEKTKAKETIVDGIVNALQAFIDLFNGTNIGKMVVQLV